MHCSAFLSRQYWVSPLPSWTLHRTLSITHTRPTQHPRSSTTRHTRDLRKHLGRSQDIRRRARFPVSKAWKKLCSTIRIPCPKERKERSTGQVYDGLFQVDSTLRSSTALETAPFLPSGSLAKQSYHRFPSLRPAPCNRSREPKATRRQEFRRQHLRTPRDIEARARSPQSTDLNLHLATARAPVPQDRTRHEPWAHSSRAVALAATLGREETKESRQQPARHPFSPPQLRRESRQVICHLPLSPTPRPTFWSSTRRRQRPSLTIIHLFGGLIHRQSVGAPVSQTIRLGGTRVCSSYSSSPRLSQLGPRVTIPPELEFCLCSIPDHPFRFLPYQPPLTPFRFHRKQTPAAPLRRSFTTTVAIVATHLSIHRNHSPPQRPQAHIRRLFPPSTPDLRTSLSQGLDNRTTPVHIFETKHHKSRSWSRL